MNNNKGLGKILASKGNVAKVHQKIQFFLLNEFLTCIICTFLFESNIHIIFETVVISTYFKIYESLLK